MKKDNLHERQLYSPPSFFFGDTREAGANKLLNGFRAAVLTGAVICCVVIFVWFVILLILGRY